VRRGRRQLGLEVERLQHRDGHVLGRGDARVLPAAARLDRVRAGRRQLDEVELAALRQEHARLVGAGVEVQRAGVDPADRRCRVHLERAQDLVGSGLRELGLGRPGRLQVEAEPVLAAAGDTERVDGLADAALGPDAVALTLDALRPDVLRSRPGAALAPRQRREGLVGRVVDAGSVAQQVQSTQHHAGPLRMAHRILRTDVAVKRQQGHDGDPGQD